MDDLISRQAAINATWFEPSYTDPLNVLTEVRDRLMMLPSVQPERKKGKWIKAQYVLTSNPPKYVWNCSECGKSVNGYSAVVLTDYCPNCGSYNGGAE